MKVKIKVYGEYESSEKRVSVTLKLQEAPYIRIKTYGAINRRSNQSILEEALSDWLNKVSA
jgi:hypothetical protein